MPKVAILLNTIDRYGLLDSCVGTALRSAGYAFDLFWCDNGSTDKRVIEYMRRFNPLYERLNENNGGCAKMHNQMLVRAAFGYDMFCLLDNDIDIGRNDWLKELVETYEAIPESGVVGIHTQGIGADPYPPEIRNGITIHAYLDVFGTRLFSLKVLDKVGYFFEDYGLYGLVDNEFNYRAHSLGFLNYYLDGPSSKHLGADVSDSSDYRRMKDEAMRVAQPIYQERMARCLRNPMSLYVPAPELR